MGNIICQQFWLKPTFVRIDHCNYTLIKVERRQGTESADNSNVQSENEDAEAIEYSQSRARSKGKPRSGPITNEKIDSEAAYMVSEFIQVPSYKKIRTV